MSSTKNYNPGKIKPLVKIIASICKEIPGVMDDDDYLMAVVRHNVPELEDTEHCANCGASMLEYIFEFDCLDALLLVAMARQVRAQLEKQGKTPNFTEANAVRVQHLNTASYAMKSRTTQCSKLGLIAKFKGANGRHVPGMWLITKRGWAALRGEQVPKSVRVWRGKIEERPDEMTTISQAFQYHRDKVEAAIKRNKQPKSDYRAAISEYQPQDWYKFGDAHQGNLI